MARLKFAPFGFATVPVPFGTNTHWAHLVIKDKKLYVRHGTSLMVYDIAVS